MRANETYSETKRQFIDRNRAVLMNVQSPHKWWSSLKSAVFGSSSSLLFLVREGGGLVCESVGKANLPSDHFDDKQSREAVDLLLTCHPSPSLTTFAFMSREVRSGVLLDLDLDGVTDPFGMFPLFLKRTADVMAPRLSEVFMWLVRLGSFSACRRQANVTTIPKGPLSSSVANYRPVSITSVLSKVFEHLASDCLRRFMEHSGVLSTNKFAYRKGLGTCDALLCLSHTMKSALESWQEARIVQIDFSAAFERVNHQAFSIGTGLWVLEFCVVNTDRVSAKPITTRCGGWLSE